MVDITNPSQCTDELIEKIKEYGIKVCELFQDFKTPTDLDVQLNVIVQHLAALISNAEKPKELLDVVYFHINESLSKLNKEFVSNLEQENIVSSLDQKDGKN